MQNSTYRANLTVDEQHLLNWITLLRDVHGLTYEQIQSEYYPDASVATVWRCHKGIMPSTDQARIAMGLPLYGVAKRCMACGDVHTTLRCTKKPPNRSKHKRRAIPFGSTTAEKAAVIIWRHRPSTAWVKELIEWLRGCMVEEGSYGHTD